MSTEEPSKCCVCGAPTTKRCQACAKSGIDLFFCSPEHQKLVWKHHKQVCGPNAHPFAPPPLTEEELQGLLRYARTERPMPMAAFPLEILRISQQVGSTTATGLTTIAETLEQWARMPAGSFEQRIVPLLRNPASVTDHDSRYLLLTKARSSLLLHLEGFAGSSTGDIYQHTIWSQIARLATWAGQRKPLISTEADMRRVSRINHQLLVLITISRAQRANESSIPDAWICREFEQLVDMLAEVRSFTSHADLNFVTHFFISRISTLTRRPYRMVPYPGGCGFTLRYADRPSVLAVRLPSPHSRPIAPSFPVNAVVYYPQ
ncbi:hypothetical protein JCM10049v2_003508 [Rhodotorula toruloides]